jgi:putative transposase
MKILQRIFAAMYQYLRHPVCQYNPSFSVHDLNAHFISNRHVRETLKLLPQKPDPILIQGMGCRITKIGSIDID